MMDKDRHKILITCAKGISPYLREELSALRYPIISESIAGIMTECSPDDIPLLNISLRTAHRVLLLLQTFTASDIGQFYRSIKNIRWENYLLKDAYFSVSSHVETKMISDSRYANKKCKDAIVDRFRGKYGRRPDSGPAKNRLVLFLYWKDDVCSVYIDTSGEPLSKRNYRKIPLRAPMQETLAAAVIMASGWHGNSHFVNPMCGSGTLAIEAAMAKRNIPPGILRDNFGFMHVRGFDRAAWNRIVAQAQKRIIRNNPYKIIVSDRDRKAVSAAKKNARAAGVHNDIVFQVCDYKETLIPPGSGVVMLNPAYGERLGRNNQLATIYKEIGDFFKQQCQGYRGYVFTGNLPMTKKIGLRPKRRLQFFSGKIECRLLEYELYAGSGGQ